MQRGLTTAQLAEIRKVFESFDKNGDGSISKDELKVALNALGQTPTEVELVSMIRDADKDFSGTIDFDEFTQMMQTCERLKQAARHTFRRKGAFVDMLMKGAGDRMAAKKPAGARQEAIEDGAEESGSDESESEPETEGRCTDNIKVLALTATLFAVITLMQTVGALMAGSKVLLADCVSMGVDACTYLGNIGVECVKGTKWYKPSELMVGGVSLCILTYLTFVVMFEALESIRHPGGGEEDGVNGYIVLFFACLGIVFDLASLHAFYGDSDEVGGHANMWTALLHVGADFLRSMTTFVSSILMLCFSVDTTAVDNWAALILGITILGGALFGVVELLKSADKAATVVGAVIGVAGFMIYGIVRSVA